MTYNNQNSNKGGDRNPPTHVIKARTGTGQKASYERLGAAWLNPEDGSLYIRLHGTQIIKGGFTAYPLDDDQGGAP